VQINQLFGLAGSAVENRYALIRPGGVAPSALPGWDKALCHVVISPALGARFAQLLVNFQADGLGQGNTGRNEYLVYVLEGAASLLLEDRRHRLEAGGYAYIAPGKDVQFKPSGPTARLWILQKQYLPLAGAPAPACLVAHERDAKALPSPDNPGLRLQPLLPLHPAFDLALNLLTFQPGAGLPTVATPIMERGWMLLRGEGLFRLDAQWLPAQAGDAVWTASYCPHWFVAVGPSPATWLCYEDVNRDPI
jgi:(S)-ureidoglycine aminohydrolase